MLLTKNDILLRLINSKDWPKAVDPNLICDSEGRYITRARKIIDFYLDCDLRGKKFLDFGCGKGRVWEVAKEYGPELSIGYDIETGGLDEVQAAGPYDIVLLYDVIDHVIESTPTELLSQIKNNLLAPDGRIFMRCHPWVSRNATHVFRTFNKAYAHLFIGETTLKTMGYDPLPTIKTLTPEDHYSKLVKDSGLEVERETVVKQRLEEFFMQDPMASCFREQFQSSKTPVHQIEHQYIDLILAIKAKKNKPYQETPVTIQM
jgi:2-polyprenyl-3-methyl-5-hydroxy-6-metoxy-1,4-benzoquinol methylase